MISGLSTVAGPGTSSSYADGIGVQALFKSPRGVVVDSSGVLFVTDNGNNRIRVIQTSGDSLSHIM